MKGGWRRISPRVRYRFNDQESYRTETRYVPSKGLEHIKAISACKMPQVTLQERVNTFKSVSREKVFHLIC